MPFLMLALAPSIQAHGVIVPPQPKFVIARPVQRHGTLVAQMCDSNEKSSHEFTLTITPKSVGNDYLHVSELMMEAADSTVKPKFLLTTSRTGVPISCKPVDQSEDGQGMNYILFFLRQPLWPSAKRARSWIVSIPNPLEDKLKSMKIMCKAHLARSKTTILLEEKTAVLKMDNGASLQITSTLEVDRVTGEVSAVSESVDMFADGKKSQVITYRDHL